MHRCFVNSAMSFEKLSCRLGSVLMILMARTALQLLLC